MNFAKYAERVVILVRGDSLSSTMSQYLIDQIKETPNIQLWAHASVVEAHGETHLEEISVLCSDTNKIERVPASSMFIFIGALPRTDWLAGSGRARRTRIHSDRSRSDTRRATSQGLDSRARSFSAGDQCSRYFCRGRCAARFGEASGFRSGRRIGGGAVHPSVFEQGVGMIEKSELLRVPAFADLPDDQIAWFISQAEELQLKAGDTYFATGRSGGLDVCDSRRAASGARRNRRRNSCDSGQAGRCHRSAAFFEDEAIYGGDRRARSPTAASCDFLRRSFPN